MFVPIAVMFGSAFGLTAVIALRSPVVRAVRTQFDLLARSRDDELDGLESFDEPVPVWLRPGGN